jgi:hypothetical protein
MPFYNSRKCPWNIIAKFMMMPKKINESVHTYLSQKACKRNENKEKDQCGTGPRIFDAKVNILKRFSSNLGID